MVSTSLRSWAKLIWLLSTREWDLTPRPLGWWARRKERKRAAAALAEEWAER